MKLALVASSYLPHPGGLERRVHELARGLARRGVQVEVLAQGPPYRLPPFTEFDGFVVRRFAASVGHGPVAVAPGLWEHLRRRARSFDLVHVHSNHASLAFAAARAAAGRFVFTPQAPVERLLHWRHAAATRALIERSAQTICTAAVEGELLRRRFPSAAERIWAVPNGVDVAAIQAAEPFSCPGSVVLSVGRLERYKRIDRAIAAVAGLDAPFQLVVVGHGPARQRLLAHAADLAVSSRVEFVGPVPDSERYRWLRTGRVVVALAEQASSGLELAEALSAGAPVVASDIAVHREAARHADGAGVTFVPVLGSPLRVADAIGEATALRVPPATQLRMPSWDEVVDGTLVIYAAAIAARPKPAPAGRYG